MNAEDALKEAQTFVDGISEVNKTTLDTAKAAWEKEALENTPNPGGGAGDSNETKKNVKQNTNAYNLLLMTDGTVTRAASSSKRYKDIGDAISEMDIDNWYKIEPVWAKYKDGYLAEGDENEGRYLPMFIAEDVEEHFPQAATHANNQIEDWNYRMMIPAMFAMIKSQKSEIDNLKEDMKELRKIIKEMRGE